MMFIIWSGKKYDVLPDKCEHVFCWSGANEGQIYLMSDSSVIVNPGDWIILDEDGFIFKIINI
jgi:hypothetical protein